MGLWLRSLIAATIVAAAALLWPTTAGAQVPAGFTDTLVASVGSPTDHAFTPDGRLLITTQPGTLRVYSGTLLPTPALTFAPGAICTESERGLLGVAVDPAFPTNGFVYLYYTANIAGVGCKNRVSRFTLPGSNVINPASELILIDRIHSTAGNHNGGDLDFGGDGYLYASVGDGGSDYLGDSGAGGANDAARDRNVLIGKILRITSDGGIPLTNPFQGAGTARCNVTGSTTPGTTCQETFAWGLRNPFRIAFDPGSVTSRFFINDVGQNAWEEIDLGQAGADYGWNCREGAHTNSTSGKCSPTPPNLVEPVFEYGHSDPNPIFSTCGAITGGAFVPAGSWPVTYDGSYLFADINCGRIFQRTPGGAVSQFAAGVGSIVNLGFGPFNGSQALYYLTYTNGGEVRRVAFTGAANRAPLATVSGHPTTGPAPLTVGFDATGSVDPDAGDTLTYVWNFGDGTPTATTATPTTSHTYASGAVFTFTAILRVQDNHGGLSDPAAVLVTLNNASDFSGDDKADVLWRYRTSGDNVVWYMNGTVLNGGAVLTAADPVWRIAGTSDFNLDGSVDILWRNQSTGQNLVWFMTGPSISGGAFLPTVTDLNWRIVGTGDFNADGHRDILWRHQATGANLVWFMSGASTIGSASLLPVTDLNWTVGGVGDFNGDGKADIVWRNPSTGANAVWFLNGAAIAGGASLPSVADTNWRIAAIADYDGNGWPDIVWRHQVTGDNVVWRMDRTSIAGGVVLPVVTDTVWEILGPR